MDLSEVEWCEAGPGCCCPCVRAESCWDTPGAGPAAGKESCKGRGGIGLSLQLLLRYQQAPEPADTGRMSVDQELWIVWEEKKGTENVFDGNWPNRSLSRLQSPPNPQ
ncbi:hypothetical protein DV515_00013194, partial [Chloebia gouldiae]